MMSETLTPASDLRSWSDAPPQDSLQMATSVEFFIPVEKIAEKIQKYASPEGCPCSLQQRAFFLAICFDRHQPFGEEESQQMHEDCTKAHKTSSTIASIK
jgi:hypothetical protein